MVYHIKGKKLNHTKNTPQMHQSKCDKPSQSNQQASKIEDIINTSPNDETTRNYVKQGHQQRIEFANICKIIKMKTRLHLIIQPRSPTRNDHIDLFGDRFKL